MKLSPMILSAALASGHLLQTTSEPRRLGEQHRQHQQHEQHPPSLMTEHFLQPTRQPDLEPGKVHQHHRQQHHQQPPNDSQGAASSVADVVKVPASGNRDFSIYQRPGGASGTLGSTDEHKTRASHQPLLRQQPWALPLAGLSAAAMLLMAAFEIFVLLKARAAAPSRRHLFLGQALLLGLFLLAGLSAAASLTANPISCAAFRLVGLPAALVFAALLVKCVFLLSLNSGVYLPAPYQALVLAFAVLVQVAVVGQWLYVEPPAVIQPQQSLKLDRFHTIATSCKTPLGQTVASLGYPCMLLLAVTCLAIRARGVRDNYRESTFIGLAVGLALPVWTTAAIGSFVAGESEREAWLAYGLLATAYLVFLAMFLPKGRQLAALSREGTNGVVTAATIRAAEREERLSSLPGSGYSPSFFHFKPAESSLKRKMHYHSADRVALVSSGIPGCNACRHGGSPVYSEGTSASNFEHMPYLHGPMETFVLPPGMYLRPEDTGNLYTTLSANPNVFFQRAHPGMMY